VGLENSDKVIAIDTLSNKVIGEAPVGQAPQALLYVPNAVPEGDGLQNLQPLGVAGLAVHLSLMMPGMPRDKHPTSVTLFDQGLTQILQAAVSGLEPMQPYTLALASRPDGAGPLEPLSSFKTNAAGAAIVNAVGPIRQLVHDKVAGPRRYLVIVSASKPAKPVQIQTP
jgi:hypothetical protein